MTVINRGRGDLGLLGSLNPLLIFLDFFEVS